MLLKEWKPIPEYTKTGRSGKKFTHVEQGFGEVSAIESLVCKDISISTTFLLTNDKTREALLLNLDQFDHINAGYGIGKHVASRRIEPFLLHAESIAAKVTLIPIMGEDSIDRNHLITERFGTRIHVVADPVQVQNIYGDWAIAYRPREGNAYFETNTSKKAYWKVHIHDVKDLPENAPGKIPLQKKLEREDCIAAHAGKLADALTYLNVEKLRNAWADAVQDPTVTLPQIEEACIKYHPHLIESLQGKPRPLQDLRFRETWEKFQECMDFLMENLGFYCSPDRQQSFRTSYAISCQAATSKLTDRLSESAEIYRQKAETLLSTPLPLPPGNGRVIAFYKKPDL